MIAGLVDMNYKRKIVFLVLLAMACTSCKKDHYDMDHLQGVNAEGELLLPIGSASFTLMKLMQQFKIDSLINCSEDGNLSYAFHYEDFGVLNGDSLLRFKDLDYSERFSMENPFPVVLPQSFDTVFSFDQTIVFESENIHVMEAEMKSGHFEFDLNSNIGLLQRLVLRSSDIKDAEGHELKLDFDFNSNDIQFDLDGLHYTTDTANTLDLSYEVYVRVQGSLDPELYFEANVKGSDLAIKEMSGYVDRYDSRNYIDTTFNLFPGNVSGALEVKGARMRLSERNTFDLEARLDVDTAWVFGDDNVPFSIFGAHPVSVDVPSQLSFGQVFERTLNGKISANETAVYASSNFIVNPSGMSNLVSVSDTCSIDIIIDTEIPFAFVVDDVRYLDTTVLALSGISKPDQIEKLTLELTITSTVPLNMNAQFFTYDSETERITDTLVAKDKLIGASFEGRPTMTELTLEVTGDKVQHLIESDRLISCYALDTEAHDVVLNGQQRVDAFMKARVKYNGVVDF